MSEYAWTGAFASLDFVREARIDLRMLPRATHDGTRLKLTAVTSRSGHHPLATREKEGHLVFRLGDFGLPVEQLVLETDDGKRLLSVDGLFFSDDATYNDRFRSNSKRPKDPFLNYFLARQLLLYFPESPSYRISGAVVAVYKAVELMVPEFLDEADEFLQTSQNLLPNAPVARSPRMNREHLQLSLWCAEWHLHLARGDFGRFLKCLHKIRNHLETEELASYFNPAYPANRSLLMLCLYYCASNEVVEAKRVAKLAASLFRRSVADSDNNFHHFEELGGIHEAAVNCLALVRQGKTVTPEVIERTFSASIRAGGPKHPAAFDAMLNTFRRGLSLVQGKE